jgi:hypothetical protein
LSNPIQDIIDILENEEGLARKRQLCDIYIQQNNRAAATEVRNQIVEEFGLDNYVQLLDLKLGVEDDFILHLSYSNDLQESSLMSTIGVSTGNTLKVLKQLAKDNSDPFTANRAKAYLSIALDTIYPVEIDPINTLPTMKMARLEGLSETGGKLQIFPNPTDGSQITILLDGSIIRDDVPVCMDIYSITGEHISRTNNMKEVNYLNVDNLSAGVYVVKIHSQEGIIESRKLIVN